MTITEQRVTFGKFNPHHDSRGRFARAGGGGGGSEAHAAQGEAGNKVQPHVLHVVHELRSQGIGLNKPVSHGPETDAEIRRHAEHLHARASADAGPVTLNLTTAAVNHDHGHLQGVEFRVKKPDSMARKIAADMAADGVDVRHAANHVGDAMRFTAVFSHDQWGQHVTGMMNDLTAQGYRVLKWKNTFGSPDNYRGINANLVTPDGKHVIELQFHTTQSLEVKEEMHILYDPRREIAHDHPHAATLDAERKRLAQHVVQPEGWDAIPNFAEGPHGTRERPMPFEE